MVLLERLHTYVQKRINSNQHLTVLHDLPGVIGCEKPPYIGQFRPDLYASDAPTSCVIIGEAKTAQDLETPRSREQINAFARYLALYPGSTFILAVPWQLRVRAQTIMLQALRSAGADQVAPVVVDDLQEISQ